MEINILVSIKARYKFVVEQKPQCTIAAPFFRRFMFKSESPQLLLLVICSYGRSNKCYKYIFKRFRITPLHSGHLFTSPEQSAQVKWPHGKNAMTFSFSIHTAHSDDGLPSGAANKVILIIYRHLPRSVLLLPWFVWRHVTRQRSVPRKELTEDFQEVKQWKSHYEKRQRFTDHRSFVVMSQC